MAHYYPESEYYSHPGQPMHYSYPVYYGPPPPLPIEGAWIPPPPPPSYHDRPWSTMHAHVEKPWVNPTPPDILTIGISPFYFDTISQKTGQPIHALQSIYGEKLPLIVIAEAFGLDDWPTIYKIYSKFNINVNIPLNGSLSLLWYAARDGKFHIVQNLLIMGANPNVFDVATKEGPLDFAIRKRFNRLEHLLKAYKAHRYPRIPEPKIQPQEQKTENEEAKA